MREFEIKYEIFEDHLEALKALNVRQFDAEWHQIYGCFALVIGGYEFFEYPAPDLPLSAQEMYSELLLTHFDLLIDTYELLRTQNYIAIKYIENPSSWLEIQAHDDILHISELEDMETPVKALIQTDSSQLHNASAGYFANVKVNKSDFLAEIRTTILRFMQEIHAINRKLLGSVHFSKIMQFTRSFC